MSDETLGVAQDLRALVEMHAQLELEVEFKANDRELPGGEALVMLGPVANLEAWAHRQATIERLWWESDDTDETDRPLTFEDEDETFEPPLQTLLFWSEAWRIEHGREMDGRPTLGTEAAFIGQVLQWAWQNEPHFDDFAKDVASARRRVENVLREGIRQTKGIPCPTCRSAALIRTDHEVRGLLDEWTCYDCGNTLALPEYQAAVLREYVAKAHYLPAQFVERRTNVKPGTVRVWATRGFVRTERHYVTVNSEQVEQVVYCIEDIEKRSGESEEVA